MYVTSQLTGRSKLLLGAGPSSWTSHQAMQAVHCTGKSERTFSNFPDPINVLKHRSHVSARLERAFYAFWAPFYPTPQYTPHRNTVPRTDMCKRHTKMIQPTDATQRVLVQWTRIPFPSLHHQMLICCWHHTYTLICELRKRLFLRWMCSGMLRRLIW
jgi:hypothetical protein